jgi:hypothetical protein
MPFAKQPQAELDAIVTKVLATLNRSDFRWRFLDAGLGDPHNTFGDHRRGRGWL